MEKIKLWGFFYCFWVHESSEDIMSYHRTKKGATKAMRIHKQAAREKNKKLNDIMKQRDGATYYPIKFGMHESWDVRRFELIIQD